jgi:hypothetical protein
MNLNIHIERLVVGPDTPPWQVAVIKAAFESHLTQLLARGGIDARFQQGRAIDRLQTPPVGNLQTRDPAHMGRWIAQAVHGGLQEGMR